jgi:hypothetical protein
LKNKLLIPENSFINLLLLIYTFTFQVIYPSIDPYDYHREERIKLHLLNPEDLSVITIIETSTLSNKVGHLFMMCGVLYATDPNTENKPGVIRSVS